MKEEKEHSRALEGVCSVRRKQDLKGLSCTSPPITWQTNKGPAQQPLQKVCHLCVTKDVHANPFYVGMKHDQSSCGVSKKHDWLHRQQSQNLRYGHFMWEAKRRVSGSVSNVHIFLSSSSRIAFAAIKIMPLLLLLFPYSPPPFSVVPVLMQLA